MSKAGFMKDALILCAITLIAGFALGGVYQITKEPIAQAVIAANNKAYRAVFPEAESFESDEALTGAIEGCNEALAAESFGSVEVESVLLAVDAAGSQLGYVVNSVSNESYSGAVRLSVGMEADGTVKGIEILEINDTPGLGMKAKEPAFKDQFVGKNSQGLTVVKGGNAGEEQIDSISGATITSSAVTNAVNAAMYYVHNCVNQ